MRAGPFEERTVRTCKRIKTKVHIEKRAAVGQPIKFTLLDRKAPTGRFFERGKLRVSDTGVERMRSGGSMPGFHSAADNVRRLSHSCARLTPPFSGVATRSAAAQKPLEANAAHYWHYASRKRRSRPTATAVLADEYTAPLKVESTNKPC